jgi:hypothetical protein
MTSVHVRTRTDKRSMRVLALGPPPPTMHAAGQNTRRLERARILPSPYVTTCQKTNRSSR